jgi:hypothetical protein
MGVLGIHLHARRTELASVVEVRSRPGAPDWVESPLVEGGLPVQDAHVVGLERFFSQFAQELQAAADAIALLHPKVDDEGQRDEHQDGEVKGGGEPFALDLARGNQAKDREDEQ